MIDRFRALLDRPLDPSAAQAILVFASAVMVGFAVVVLLAFGESDHQALRSHTGRHLASVASPHQPGADRAPRVARRRQDPQDVDGSAAARRAARALRAHRALQHVPYRSGELVISLVGAKRGRAVIQVSAPSVAAGRRGWLEFLRRFRDSGRAYYPRFRAATRRR